MTTTQTTQLTQSEGNIKSSDCSLKKEKRYRKWCFTLNNYSSDEEEKLIVFFDDKAKKWIFGHEIAPTTGTPHLQGYVEFKSAKTLSSWKKFNPRISLDTAKGTLLQNFNYCTKEDGNYKYGGFRPKKLTWTCKLENLYWWQQEISDIIETEPDERTVHWYWEPTGCSGKTKFQKHIVCKYRENRKRYIHQLEGKGADMKNSVLTHLKQFGEVPDCIFINLARDDYRKIDWGGIEKVKDMLFYSGKYEGGMVCGPCPHIFIFSNEPPDESRLSKDRWHIVRTDKEETEEEKNDEYSHSIGL